MLSFAVTSADGSVQRLPVAVHKLVIAGMTGRDKAKVQEHLDELAELTIQYGGRALVLPSEKLPVDTGLAAVLR